MTSLQEISVALARTGMDILAVVLSFTVYVLGTAASTFPNATGVLITIFGLYICYKMFKKIVRFWIGLFITTLKLLLALLVFTVCLAVYVRGFNTFVSVDLRHISEFLRQWANQESSTLSFKDHVYNFAFKTMPNDEKYRFLANEANTVLKDSGIEFDPSYFDHVRENADDYLQKGFDALGQFWN